MSFATNQIIICVCLLMTNINCAYNQYGGPYYASQGNNLNTARLYNNGGLNPVIPSRIDFGMDFHVAGQPHVNTRENVSAFPATVDGRVNFHASEGLEYDGQNHYQYPPPLPVPGPTTYNYMPYGPPLIPMHPGYAYQQSPVYPQNVYQPGGMAGFHAHEQMPPYNGNMNYRPMNAYRQQDQPMADGNIGTSMIRRIAQGLQSFANMVYQQQERDRNAVSSLDGNVGGNVDGNVGRDATTVDETDGLQGDLSNLYVFERTPLVQTNTMVTVIPINILSDFLTSNKKFVEFVKLRASIMPITKSLLLRGAGASSSFSATSSTRIGIIECSVFCFHSKAMNGEDLLDSWFSVYENILDSVRNEFEASEDRPLFLRVFMNDEVEKAGQSSQSTDSAMYSLESTTGKNNLPRKSSSRSSSRERATENPAETSAKTISLGELVQNGDVVNLFVSSVLNRGERSRAIRDESRYRIKRLNAKSIFIDFRHLLQIHQTSVSSKKNARKLIINDVELVIEDEMKLGDKVFKLNSFVYCDCSYDVSSFELCAKVDSGVWKCVKKSGISDVNDIAARFRNSANIWIVCYEQVSEAASG